MQTSRGVVKAVIISSEPLAKKTLTSLEAAVKNMAGAGKTVEITSQVDESILGGYRLWWETGSSTSPSRADSTICQIRSTGPRS